MRRMPTVFAFILGVACIAVDVWFLASRCGASPPLFFLGIEIGAILQVLAVGVPLLAGRWFESETTRDHLRAAGIGAYCFIASIPVLQASILYSDGVGKDRAYRSVGIECNGPALRPGHGV